MSTKVIFRKWKSDCGIIALFPEVPADTLGRYCMSYETAGQHGSADCTWVIRETLAANPSEYRMLLNELGDIGYDLEVIVRYEKKEMDLARKEEAKRTWA